MFANLKMYSPDVLTDSVEALDSNLRCYRYNKTKTLEHARGAAMDAAANGAPHALNPHHRGGARLPSAKPCLPAKSHQETHATSDLESNRTGEIAYM